MRHPLDIKKIYEANWTLLDQSENPYGFAFNRYPSLEHERALYRAYINYLNTDLGQNVGLTDENILFTRGAADAIDLILRTFCLKSGSKIAVTDPTFFPIIHWANVYDIPMSETHLSGENYDQIDVGEILESEANVCFVVNPNNPTSTALDASYLSELIQKFEGLVVVDEAYVDFCHDRSVVHLVEHHPNVMILRTMSKAWGSAGIRAGFIIASDINILALMAVQPPFMCDSYVCEHLTHLLCHRYEEFCLYRSLIIQTRTALVSFLQEFENLTVLPSDTNFVVLLSEDAGELEKILKFHDFIVKHSMFDGKQCLRISIGTTREMDRLIDIFNQGVKCAIV